MVLVKGEWFDLYEVLEIIGDYKTSLARDDVIKMSTVMWDETKSQKDGITIKTCTFPDTNLTYCAISNKTFKNL